MPAPSQASDPIAELALTLAAYEAARIGLEAVAPQTCAEHGGAEAIVARLGGEMRPHARGWFAVDFTSQAGQLIWAQMAAEQQKPYREGGYE